MTRKKPIVLLLVLLLVGSAASNAMADISNAAVLFLRIAAGARAAGMGEAFVAVADDATATHWNPAGLGAAPLADTWIDATIPVEHRPLRAVAAMRSGGPDNYKGYDLWAISDRGLIRWDNRSWNSEETFSTRSDETVQSKVAGYFGVVEDAYLEQVTKRVARAKNKQSQESRDRLLSEIAATATRDSGRDGEKH